MKRWTVMLIPQGNGATRTLNLNSSHIYVAVALLAALTFSTTFFIQRYRIAADQARQLERQNVLLADAARQVPPAAKSLSPDQREAIAEQAARAVREEYSARDAALAQHLTQLYDLETQVREMHGLPPQTKSFEEFVSNDAQGGQGGPPSGQGQLQAGPAAQFPRPPHIIYGLWRPSPDLIVEEIRLRVESLHELLDSMEAQRDIIARRPSIWPSQESRRGLSSRFGHRRDPFTGKWRMHDGLDITAPYKTPVVATARGVVESAGYERFYGNVVRINHGRDASGKEVVTVYAHLHSCLVKAGETIERGQEIGRLGSTGRSTGPHIHYEVRIDGKPVDPRKFIGS
jgi:murein DD-endopeptidase MepM/ murein hydrolase activator NlpD